MISPDSHELEQESNALLAREQSDVIQFSKLAAEDSFDVVFLLDVLEHLPKHQGWSLLYDINRIAKHGIGITVPNGFDWQPPAPENPFQAHISEWNYRDLRLAQMTKVIGSHGLKILSGQAGTKRYGLGYRTSLIYLAEVLIGRLIPSKSAKLWAENPGLKRLDIYRLETVTDRVIGTIRNQD